MVEHLYIHIPFCKDQKCLYCALYSECGAERYYARYTEVVSRELEMLVADGLEVVPQTLYLGGGTPGVLGSAGLRTLISGLAAVVDLRGVGEFSMELHPQVATAELLSSVAELGVNRLSFGVQSFNDTTLQRAGRGHSAAEAVAAIRLAQQMGFENVGIDLIAGLPGEDSAGWCYSLASAVELELLHLSVYGLGVESGSGLEEAVEVGEVVVPDDEYQMEALRLAEEELRQAGFVRYEVSNYARPGCECRHNLAIWRGADYLGLGCGASSRVGQQRWSNNRGVAKYIEQLERGCQPVRELTAYSEKEDAVERVVHRVRLREGVPLAEVVGRYPVLSIEVGEWRRIVVRLEKHGIAFEQDGHLRLTPRGFEVSDSVIKCLILI